MADAAAIDPALVVVGSAFGGAIIGGFVGSVGSYFVSRYEQTRRIRVEIHRELLPPALDAVMRAAEGARQDQRPLLSDYEDLVVRLFDAAMAAGHRDYKATRAVAKSLASLGTSLCKTLLRISTEHRSTSMQTSSSNT